MAYDSDLSFNYFGPTKVIFGVGSLSELPIEVSALGQKAVLVTDEGLMATGLVEQVQEKLGNLLVHTYSDVPQDSGMAVVDNGAQEALSDASTSQMRNSPSRSEMKAICDPSGDQTGDELMDCREVSGSASPPASGWTKISDRSPKSRANATRSPSGERLGCVSSKVPEVSTT